MTQTPTESPMVLSQEQIDFFQREGYLVLPPITTADELAGLRKIYDRLFAERDCRNHAAVSVAVSVSNHSRIAARPRWA